MQSPQKSSLQLVPSILMINTDGNYVFKTASICIKQSRCSSLLEVHFPPGLKLPRFDQTFSFQSGQVTPIGQTWSWSRALVDVQTYRKSFPPYAKHSQLRE
uniref:(northern house mosquito) hypothetical protein n=1 Tax=Culex pipiens TaxID=7175 RepID=A0A8D8NIH9_CULPI